MEAFLTDLRALADDYYLAMVDLIPRLVMGLLLFLLFLFVANRTRKFSRRRLHEYLEDPLLANFLGQAIRYSFILIGLIGALGILGLGKAASGLLAGAGLGAFILGFAFKDIIEHFLAGILMAFKRPFRIGDVVKLGDIQGKIVGLTIRDTQVKTFDGKDVYIPNGVILKNPIVNFTIDGFLRDDFVIGLDYGADWPVAREVIKETLAAIPGILQGEKAPTVIVDALATSTLNVKVFFWINTFDPSVSGLSVKSRAMWECIKALEAAGFYLPADILEVKSYPDSSIVTSVTKGN
jgi:small-conductance mechanosensitive channel